MATKYTLRLLKNSRSINNDNDSKGKIQVPDKGELRVITFKSFSQVSSLTLGNNVTDTTADLYAL